MKPLTERQAARCENAKHGRCRCRCQGAFHGTRQGDMFRSDRPAPTREFFESLPPDDPHHVPPKKDRK